MTVGIVGLGLIGGSVAKALKHGTAHTVYGYDISEAVLRKARQLNAIDAELGDGLLLQCDMLIIATYSGVCIDYVKSKLSIISKSTIVMDCCGIKGPVCKALFPLAKEAGFTFIGAHPMAGIEYSGFDNSQRKLFNNASLILVPPEGTAPELLERVKGFWRDLGFSNFEVTTHERHDKIIAYTSQLAHVASSAYIKSRTATEHAGFSAGSYKDMTRVARLNENMWTELFLDNAEYLAAEIDEYVAHLQEYGAAIKAHDAATLKRLLKEGRERKELADKDEECL